MAETSRNEVAENVAKLGEALLNKDDATAATCLVKALGTLLIDLHRCADALESIAADERILHVSANG